MSVFVARCIDDDYPGGDVRIGRTSRYAGDAVGTHAYDPKETSIRLDKCSKFFVEFVRDPHALGNAPPIISPCRWDVEYRRGR